MLWGINKNATESCLALDVDRAFVISQEHSHVKVYIGSKLGVCRLFLVRRQI